ncbi:MAG TPA: AIR synthase-related protein, partial [Bacillota bacterium]|nr:AIR synthase-related protein [Bacillota bacterium]
ESAQAMMGHISVVKEGMIAGETGATAMHDVTEGGVLGALWELAEASGVGLRIYRDKIPVRPETRAICEELGLNPLKLISSGCMLISCRDGQGMLEALNREGIPASIIGEVVEEGRTLVDGEREVPIDPPESDELYKVQ